MTPDFMQWILGQAGVAGVAALALWMLNETWKARLEDQKQFADVLDDHRNKLMAIVEQNAKAMTENAVTNRELITAIRELQDAVQPKRRTTK